jgi:twitching motility protein PilT
MIDYINENRYDHILTVEDPIEFVHQSKKCLINQREVHRDTHGFNAALRSALREDPDIILVGEMRDLRNHSTWHSLRLKQVTWFSVHYIRPLLRKPLTVSSTYSLLKKKTWFVPCLSESLQAVISQTYAQEKWRWPCCSA